MEQWLGIRRRGGWFAPESGGARRRRHGGWSRSFPLRAAGGQGASEYREGLRSGWGSWGSSRQTSAWGLFTAVTPP